MRERVKAGMLEGGLVRDCANIASSRQAKKSPLPLRLDTYYLIMIQCLHAHVSMIEITIAQLTAYQEHGINPIGHALCSFDGGCLSHMSQISPPPPTAPTVLDIPLQWQLLVAQASAGRLPTLSMLSCPILLPCLDEFSLYLQCCFNAHIIDVDRSEV
jgi:hypothetical protein